MTAPLGERTSGLSGELRMVPPMPEENQYRHWLVKHLHKNRDRLLSGWKNAVLEDREIPSADKLTMVALEDHLPEMLEELVDAIDPTNGGVLVKDTQSAGREHGKSRWRQGYRLDEIIRELNRLREMVVESCRRFTRDVFPRHNDEVEIQLIRRFFDTVVATSAQQFAASQEAEMILRTNQLRNAYEQAQAATEELRSVSESRLHLLRGVVHELRNAIQPIGLSAVSLLEETHPMDRQVLGQQLTKVGGRLQTLLDRLLQYSEILSGEARLRAETFALSELLHDLKEANRIDAERKGIVLECKSNPAHLETVRTDREKLLQIGTTLIDNAIINTETGSVEIDCIPTEGTDRWILRVTDTGCGISQDQAQHIFKGVHSDTGFGLRLGLLLARHLAQLLGGEITFRSQVGEGTQFEVNLPRSIENAPTLRHRQTLEKPSENS